MNILIDFPELQRQLMTACRRALLGEEVGFIIENKAIKNLAYCCYELKLGPIYDECNQSMGIMFLIRNITDYKRVERKKFKQQAELAYVAKMNTMREMASILAHEINQPLMVINAYSRACLLKIQKGLNKLHELINPLEQIAAQAEYAGEIIHRMKSSIQGDRIFHEEVDINQLIREALGFISYDLEEFKINTCFKFAEDLPLIRADSVQITQVILNLVRNSIEALQWDYISNPEITLSTNLSEDGNLIEINVIDNGPGIPSKIHELMTNAYVTTESNTNSLGLAICRTLIAAHGGKLVVKPNPIRGAWVQFTLPLKFNGGYIEDST